MNLKFKTANIKLKIFNYEVFHFVFRNPQSAIRNFFLLVALALTSAASAAAPKAPETSWRPPDPLELKDQEIRLLKRQLAQARRQLESDHVGRIVYETQLRVAALHGFTIKEVVNYAPLTGGVVDRLVNDSFAAQYPGKALEDYVWLNQLFAALPQPFELKRTFRDLMGEQAAGIYDPHAKRLFVKTDFALEGPMGQIILSHEICHAFQDQNFSLIDMGTEDAQNADLALATLSLAEGDATILMSEYFARYGNAADFLRFLPSVMSMDQQKLEAAPAALQESLLFPYLKGMQFFQALGGRTRKNPTARGIAEAAWRNEIFKDPPLTTQQIMHPELYLSRKMPANVETPRIEGGGTPTVNVAGEFGTALLLESLLGPARADAIAAGWNGDKLAVAEARDGRRRLIRWATRWDTPEQAGAFAAALEEFFTARFAKALTWKGAATARVGTSPAAQVKILRQGRNGVELQGSFDKTTPFPKVKTKPPRPSLPSF